MLHMCMKNLLLPKDVNMCFLFPTDKVVKLSLVVTLTELYLYISEV